MNSYILYLVFSMHQKFIGMTKHCLLLRTCEPERDSISEHPVSGFSKHLKSERQTASSKVIRNATSNLERSVLEAATLLKTGQN